MSNGYRFEDDKPDGLTFEDQPTEFADLGTVEILQATVLNLPTAILSGTTFAGAYISQLSTLNIPTVILSGGLSIDISTTQATAHNIPVALLSGSALGDVTASQTSTFDLTATLLSGDVLIGTGYDWISEVDGVSFEDIPTEFVDSGPGTASIVQATPLDLPVALLSGGVLGDTTTTQASTINIPTAIKPRPISRFEESSNCWAPNSPK